MIAMTAVLRDGSQLELSGTDGVSVMETLRRGGVEEVLALCGGCCSCATCHVYVEYPAMDQLPPMQPDEDDLLDSSGHRTELSRLSCQLTCGPALDGLRVRVAPEE